MLYIISMDNNSSSKTSINFASLSGTMLSIAIMVIRAFQPNAQPIESWSAFSWFLMLLPIIVPILFTILFFAIWFIVNVFSKP